MMKKKSFGFLSAMLGCMMITIPILQGQESDTTNIDSASASQVSKTVELIRQADSITIADSITTVILKKQLEDLRASETARRKKIEAELERIQQADSIRRQDLKQQVEKLKREAVGYPVIPYKDTLFAFYTNIGSITAQERAKVVSDRLDELYHAFFIKADSLEIVDNGPTVDIFYKDKIILSITEMDALWFGKSKTDIALEFQDKILTDIDIFKRNRSFLSLLKDIGLVLLVILIQVGLIKLINLFFRGKVNVFIWKKRGVWFKGIHLRNYQVIDQTKQTSLILFVTKLVRYFIIALLLYLTIPILFSIFPPTQRMAETLFGYILTPVRKIVVSVVNYIPELITIIVIIVITNYVLKLLKYLAKEVENEKLTLPGFYPDWARPTLNIVKVLFLAFMFVMLFPYLPGSDSDIFKGVTVFLGLVISLGSTSVIGNMVAGLVITYMRPFQIGDRIKIGDTIGDVVEKTAFVTRLRTPKKEFITIPNSTILATSVTNYSTSRREDGIILHTTVTIGYDVPWRKVHEVLIDAALKTTSINLKEKPFVLQTSLDDFYVSYQLNAHTNEPAQQPRIYSELHQYIQDGFNAAGIEILSPHYRTERDGNQSTVAKK